MAGANWRSAVSRRAEQHETTTPLPSISRSTATGRGRRLTDDWCRTHSNTSKAIGPRRELGAWLQKRDLVCCEGLSCLFSSRPYPRADLRADVEKPTSEHLAPWPSVALDAACW